MVEEESTPCQESFGIKRIGQWLGYVWSPSLLLGQPLLPRGWPTRLLLAQLLEPENQALQQECGFYGSETHIWLTLSLGHGPLQ